MSLRAIKARARRDLHNAMRVPAFYYPAGDADAAPVPCHVRVHTKFNAQLGDLKGTNFSYAETEAQIEKLVFWIDELDPDNQAVVMVSSIEGYRINHVHPRDGATRTVEVAQLDEADLALYEHPAGAVY